MKHKHLFTLLDTSFAIATVSFDSETPKRKPRQSREEVSRLLASNPTAPAWDPGEYLRDRAAGYDYKVPKSWDVEVGDQLIVDTPNGKTQIVLVEAVDHAANIDPDADHSYRWAVQKVDRTEYHTLVDKEEKFQQTMLEIERTAQREQAAAKYREHLPEGSEASRLFDEAVAAIQGRAPEADEG